ncbi:hypothetical protein [Lactococcus cremoris]
MALIDEIKITQKESHKKWFDEWYAKIELENEIKKSAMKGYTYYKIYANDEDGLDLTIRLENRYTVDLIKEKLGKGFNAELKETHGENFWGMAMYKPYIHIWW